MSDEPVRGRNYNTLASLNPIHGLDERISYDDASHTYHVDGSLVPISVTKLLKRITNETEFVPDRVINDNIDSWRRKPRSEYGAMIAGLSDDEARIKIKQFWVDANRLGTQLHLQLEAVMNSQPCVIDEDTTTEWDMVKVALREMVTSKGWKPYRSELSVFYEAKSPDINAHKPVVVCAGQIDALFTDENGHLVIVDLKRVKRPLKNVPPFEKKVCLPPMDLHWANEFVKYSLQLSMYCVMVEQRTGIKIDPENRLLLQAHPTMDRAMFVNCDCFDAEARCILEELAVVV
jgi:hypothetical protein